jgi:PD-(D/E)XK nuclease superfamily protein
MRVCHASVVRSANQSEVVLTTDQKGAIAETAIAHEAVKLGFDVYKPINEGTRYDLILDIDWRLIRVQCKWASRHGDVLVVRAYSCRRTAHGLLRRAYTAQEIDAFAAYCAERDRCYLLPIECFPQQRQIQVRLGPTKNNHQLGVDWARDYEFAARLERPQGAVAQLGERVAGSHEVRGSSPLGSIDSAA